jgi:hypothetical protein
MMKIPAFFAWVLLGAGLMSHWMNDFAAPVASPPEPAPAAAPQVSAFQPIRTRKELNDALDQLSFRVAYSSKTFEYFVNDDGVRILARFDDDGSVCRLAIGAGDEKHLPISIMSRVIWRGGKVPDFSEPSETPVKVGNYTVWFPATAGLNTMVNIVAWRSNPSDCALDGGDLECALRAAGLHTYAPESDDSVLYFNSVEDPKLYTTACGALHLRSSTKGIGQIDVSRGTMNAVDADIAISAIAGAVSNAADGVSKNAADTKRFRYIEIGGRSEFGPQLCAVLVFPNFIMIGEHEPAHDPMTPVSMQSPDLGEVQPELIPPPPPMHEDSQVFAQTAPMPAEADADAAE